MPRTITSHKCEFCGRLYQRRSACEKHEAICFRNRNRTPVQGELFGYQTAVDLGWLYNSDAKDDAVMDCDPVIPDWGPQEMGSIYTGEFWVKVPGYERRPSGIEIYPVVLEHLDEDYRERLDDSLYNNRVRWKRFTKIIAQGNAPFPAEIVKTATEEPWQFADKLNDWLREMSRAGER